jgi:hypothetical protein
MFHAHGEALVIDYHLATVTFISPLALFTQGLFFACYLRLTSMSETLARRVIEA